MPLASAFDHTTPLGDSGGRAPASSTPVSAAMNIRLRRAVLACLVAAAAVVLPFAHGQAVVGSLSGAGARQQGMPTAQGAQHGQQDGLAALMAAFGRNDNGGTPRRMAAMQHAAMPNMKAGIMQQPRAGTRARGHAGSASNQAAEQRQLADVNFPPGPVIGLKVGVGENTMDPQWGQLELYWYAPEVNSTHGKARAYRVYVDGRLVGTVDDWPNAFIRHLHEGQVYEFGVSAVNFWGEGPITYVTETFQALPGAFQFFQAVPGDGTIDLYWEDPYFDGGTPVDSFLSVNPDVLLPWNIIGTCKRMTTSLGKPLPAGKHRCRIENLWNGWLYEPFVYSRKTTSKRNYASIFFHLFWDVIGTPSAPAWAVPAPLPSGPTSFRVQSGGPNTATLSWGPPEDVNPLEPVIAYQINWWEEALGWPFPEAVVFPLNTTVIGQEFRSFQIKNLTPGVPYMFSIQAVTHAGVGAMTVNPLGVPQGIYTPLGRPQEPTHVSVLGLGANNSGGAIDISWGAPAPDGGNLPINYRVTITGEPFKGAPTKPSEPSYKPWPIVRKITCSAIEPIGAPECAAGLPVFGLPYNQRLGIYVEAENEFGWGIKSKPVYYTPRIECELCVQPWPYS